MAMPSITAVVCDISELFTPEEEESSLLVNLFPDSTPYTVASVIYRKCTHVGYGFADDPTNHRRVIQCLDDGAWSDDSIKHCIRKCPRLLANTEREYNP